MVLSHRVCPDCGHYKGKEIIKGRAEGETQSGAS
jgi:hypothetical protein